jgi:hypothetical protein
MRVSPEKKREKKRKKKKKKGKKESGARPVLVAAPD